MLNDAQVKAYLDRIGFEGKIAHDKKTLDELVLRHQMAVPFETVTLHRRRVAPSLDIDDIYEKVVDKNGGGYCFELNKAFGALLESLGFDTRPVLSRAVRGREGRMPINHRGIVVDLEGETFSVDVGFGGPMPSGALLLASGPDQLINGEIYAVKCADHAWWKIERLTQANFDSYDDEVPVRRQVELELCTAATEEQDFDALNEFFSRPGTLFREHELVNLRTPGGYLGFRDGVFTVRENGQKTITELASKEEVDKVLAEKFGMTEF